MQERWTRARVTEDHEVRVTLPSDSPAGEAEVIVIAEPPETGPPGATAATDFNTWLDGTLRRLPPAPSPPLDMLRRENLYEDD
jgi:hypothetical protein